MAVVPSQRTWTAGETVTATMLNGNVRDAVNFVVTNRPRAILRQGATQTLLTAVYASVTFDIEDLDTDGGHSTTVNNSRYTAQTAGYYEASAVVALAANSTNSRSARWMVNGAAVNASLTSIGAAPTGNSVYVAATIHVFLNIGDYLELQAKQDSGSSVATAVSAELGSRMNVAWLGT